MPPKQNVQQQARFDMVISGVGKLYPKWTPRPGPPQYLVGNGVLGILGMGMGCKQSAEGPSGPPGDAVAVASVPGNWVSLAEFRGSTLI